MKCSITGCSGEYEHRRVVQTLCRRDRTIVVEDVPAEVCSICGDTLYSAETVRSIEQLLASSPEVVKTVPSFTFPMSIAPDEPAPN